MKKTIFILLLLLNSLLFSQEPSSIQNICEDYFEYEDNTYFADLNNTFQPYVGVWKYENGNEIVLFKLQKITKRYFAEEKCFKDFIVGNYSYSNDGGLSYIINTLDNVNSTNPADFPMYTPCVNDENSIEFIFKDVALNKGFCYALFTKNSTNSNQLNVTIRNPHITGTLSPQPAYNPSFTIPVSMVVTKQ